MKLDSLIEHFYAIPGVPSKAVKAEQLNSGSQHKIFIQGTSQGSRCLKKGIKILYLKEVYFIYWHEFYEHNSVPCKVCPDYALHVSPEYTYHRVDAYMHIIPMHS